MTTERIRAELAALAEVAGAVASQADAVAALAARYAAALDGGGTLYFAGNGGSAATAQHVATEYVVRYRRAGRPLPAVALTADTALLTAAGNDLGFEQVFARQVEAFCGPADLLVLHSTSGDSPNLLAAAVAAHARGTGVVALLGREGGALASRVDLAVVVPSQDTSRIQELHLAIEHIVVGLLEDGGRR